MPKVSCQIIILKSGSHSFYCFLSSGLLPPRDCHYAVRRGAGDFFEVVSHIFFGDTEYWPLVKVAASLYASDDLVMGVGLLNKSITVLEGNKCRLYRTFFVRSSRPDVSQIG